jgi:hypothetical protein
LEAKVVSEKQERETLKTYTKDTIITLYLEAKKKAALYDKLKSDLKEMLNL